MSDTVDGRDGTDSLKAVEWLKFNDALVDLSSNVTHFSDHTLDASSYDTHGTATTTDDEMYFGDGNLPTHYNVADLNDQKIELGLKNHYRTGDDITPTSVDGDGTAHYVIPDGTQVADPAHNVSGAAPNRSAWSLDFVVNTGLDGSAATLSDYTFKMVITQNGTNTHVFDLDPTTHVWHDEANPSIAFGGDDFSPHGASAQVQSQISENSINLGFGPFAAAFGPLATSTAAGTTYDVTLQAYDHQNHLLGSVHDALVMA